MQQPASSALQLLLGLQCLSWLLENWGNMKFFVCVSGSPWVTGTWKTSCMHASKCNRGLTSSGVNWPCRTAALCRWDITPSLVTSKSISIARQGLVVNAGTGLLPKNYVRRVPLSFSLSCRFLDLFMAYSPLIWTNSSAPDRAAGCEAYCCKLFLAQLGECKHWCRGAAIITSF